MVTLTLSIAKGQRNPSMHFGVGDARSLASRALCICALARNDSNAEGKEEAQLALNSSHLRSGKCRCPISPSFGEVGRT